MIGVNRVQLLGRVYSPPLPVGEKKDKLSVLVVIDSRVPGRRGTRTTNVVATYWKGPVTVRVSELSIGDRVYIEGWLKQLTFENSGNPQSKLVIVGTYVQCFDGPISTSTASQSVGTVEEQGDD